MTIRNTATEHPLIKLVTASGGIEAQEAQGQRQLVGSTQLPVKGNHDPKFAEMGIIFGASTPDDPLFCEATLPAGWSKRATDHSMWSEIVDEIGKVRASIFYKAAFYDRDAFIRVV